jgi:hypothetical protein
MVALASQLGPLIRPRYLASIEERIFIEGIDDDRTPDIWVRRTGANGGLPSTLAPTRAAVPVIVEARQLERHERYIEILDRYRDMRVVTVIELVSPSNKRMGPGRRAYVEKQQATLTSECHLIEVDLLRRGRHVLSVPRRLTRRVRPYAYLTCVNRWPNRKRFELYAGRLREPIPAIDVPLSEPDRDIPLDIQAALEQIYQDGSYDLKVSYDDPCVPPLPAEDQQWANERWAAYRAAYPELFPPQAP